MLSRSLRISRPAVTIARKRPRPPLLEAPYGRLFDNQVRRKLERVCGAGIERSWLLSEVISSHRGSKYTLSIFKMSHSLLYDFNICSTIVISNPPPPPPTHQWSPPTEYRENRQPFAPMCGMADYPPSQEGSSEVPARYPPGNFLHSLVAQRHPGEFRKLGDWAHYRVSAELSL